MIEFLKLSAGTSGYHRRRYPDRIPVICTKADGWCSWCLWGEHRGVFAARVFA